VFTARYALGLNIRQNAVVFKGLICKNNVMLLGLDSLFFTLSFTVYFSSWRQFNFLIMQGTITALIGDHLTCNHCIFFIRLFILVQAPVRYTLRAGVGVTFFRKVLHGSSNLDICDYAPVMASVVLSSYLPIFQLIHASRCAKSSSVFSRTSRPCLLFSLRKKDSSFKVKGHNHQG
jgi:hypothetical protein